MSRHRVVLSLMRWFDSDVELGEISPERAHRVELIRVVPFVLLHLACLAVFWVGWSWIALATAFGLFIVRGLALTGVYHRYFSHRTYRLNRFWQFVFAVVGTASAQRGPLWWAAHHRHHHSHADTEEDIHSPSIRGFWYSHVLWFLTPASFPTRMERVKDWARFPELLLLNRFNLVVPLLLLAGLYAVGEVISAYAPYMGTSGLQMIVWGFVISTVVLYHLTFTINSLDHMIGRRRFDTPDTSRNNWVLAILTFGEGWHNNHHRYAISARQGFYWWQVDLTYCVLKMLSWVRIVQDLRPVPEKVLAEGRSARQAEQKGVV
jgi:stearoyl-CoA desaturase (Delta-9 desaturase)